MAFSALPGQFYFGTFNGNYLAAVDGGGLIANAIDTSATAFGVLGVNEKFTLWQDPENHIAIQTPSGNFLTAVDGGGRTTDGLAYYLIPVNLEGQVVSATNGGGRVASAIQIPILVEAQPLAFAQFTLIQQYDGSYAMQTRDGYFVTADQGGGLAHGTATADNLQTNRTEAQAWERFKFADVGDGTFTIQTVSGFYIGRSDSPLSVFSTRISDIAVAERFNLQLVNI